MTSILEETLKHYLPQDHKFEILHLQNRPTQVRSIVTSSKKDRNIGSNSVTIKTPHFFALANNNKIIYGIEIHVYVILKNNNSSETGANLSYNDAERLIFISKADTNGYSDVKFSAKQITKGIIHYLFSIDPNHYLEHVIPLERKYKQSFSKIIITRETSLENALQILSDRAQQKEISQEIRSNLLRSHQHYLSFKLPNKIRTKLCLFTRPADQYLFAESSKNPNKHTLSGMGLLKWWLSIVDELLCEDFSAESEGKLRIPGEESVIVRRYLRTNKFANWGVGDIFGGEPNSLAIFSVPLFSDDPKSRFLHELVEEARVLKTNLETFWMELQERQEFKLSETVSVIGISGYTTISTEVLPTERETIITNSKKQYRYIKNYITGEEYHTEEGALESYTNIVDYLNYKYKKLLTPVVGTMPKKLKVKEPVNTPKISILKPRKKIKI
ncbi:similar to Saccharomyces cerevisiae YLL002W RTT109 Histone acetyltransferase critical for cell survival in the presence of DNA damage during S phase [Maudiozyma barnettii]|uniref:histone acetyltransferase n=1 Tax=Maudiozyma barnettii TaxID=61262 RepID=A0A8H2ZHM8_9SACH|nr:H3 histone acetyltransferase RTT109 [Kazachstania barnettii]CAB4254933.1 similar to Saccharomyces cerevisiae YLL002W RTT109 Histone acetyltransferase critical for cell survival in the presence of DNA damage during S phase [Kazachstania barnettii]CAD1783204.1 similar to Saccharomyces cerevisiae YLL002W RTT109 Histone acetyltransferase critical for cell survival in the presence of DNA damage during S phase [Kazachstania barnettii]